MDLSTTHQEPSVKGSILMKLSLYLILAAAFLAPLIFIPSTYAPLDVVKAFFISFIVLVAILLYVIGAAKHKTLVLPRGAFGYSALAVVVVTLLSTLASATISKSFLGQGFEITTASFLLLIVATAFLVSRIVIRDRETIFKIYSALFISFIILALFHIVRLFAGADFMSLGLLNSVTSTLMGKWYDFAAFVGLIGLFSLVGVKFLPLRSVLKKVLYVSLVVCGILLFIINSHFMWGIVMVVTLALAVYEYVTAVPKGTGIRKIASRISVLTAIVLVIAAVLAFQGGRLQEATDKMVENLKAGYGELILPWQITLDVTADTLKDGPFLGTGPNTFGQQYLIHKPGVINQSQYWNTEFTTGFGLIPTLAATQGLLGMIAWVLFLIFFVREGARALRKVTDPLKKFFLTSSFFGTLFLLILCIVYVPSHVIIFFTALLMGIFVALLVTEGVIAERVISLHTTGRGRRFVPALFYVSVIVLAVWLGAYVKKSIAITHFEKGLKELNLGKSADNAQAHFKKALAWDSSDIYYQALSETNILKINALVQEMQADSDAGKAQDQKKSDQLLALITDSVNYTQAAQKIDPKNYYNYVAEARIAEMATTLKIPNAYENTKTAYTKAIGVNSMNPSLYLNLARLEASQNKLTEAQQYIGRALQIKPNYIDAIFLLSQVQVANNQIQDAITSVSVAIQLNPQEPLLHFQLGLLSYSSKDYQTSVKALKEAVRLNEGYANARYFLGLSYARLGQNADAIAQFEEIAKTNADNQEVKFILENLKEGKSPFTDAKPPIDAKPEQRKTLPVTEKAGATKAPAVKKTSS